MAANQEKSDLSPIHFDFEGDTNDSDYFLVKRIEFIAAIPSRTIEQQTIKILPNAEIQLTIDSSMKFDDVRVVEIKLCNIKNDDLHMEISLHVDYVDSGGYRYGGQQNINVNFTKTLGTTNFFLKPFTTCGGSGDECTFQLVLKVPHDFNDTTMSKLFSEGELSDVDIICDGQTFQCHKVILAMKSDVFKAMLYMNKCMENLTGTVRVDDINAKTMKTMINYMYQSKVTFEEVTDLDVLVAANKYNIVELVAKCEKYILMNLSMTNVLDVLAIGKFLPTTKMFEKAMDFFRQNAGRKDVLGGPKWMQLDAQNKNEIFESCLRYET
jgi:hypothetical protein